MKSFKKGFFNFSKQKKQEEIIHHPNICSDILKSNPINFNIKILAIADTHNKLSIHQNLNFPKEINFDICILLGDISKGDIEVILKYIPKEKIIGILGNHDDLDTLEKYNITNINKNIFTFNNIKILGLEGCIKYKENQAGYSLEESIIICDNLPPSDIFITHNIPYKFMGDLNQVHIGNPAINKYLIKNQCPINICGHNHSNFQGTLSNGTTVIETYMFTLIEISPQNININKIETRIN